MEYFAQLLESYSKLKKRKLKLVEQEDGLQQAQRLADEALKAAKSQNPLPTTDQPYIAKGVRANLGIFNTSKGWKFAPLTSNGQINIGHSKFIEKDYPTFLGFFTPDDKPQEEPMEGGEEATMAMAPPSELDNTIAELQNLIPELFKQINRKLYNPFQARTTPEGGKKKKLNPGNSANSYYEESRLASLLIAGNGSVIKALEGPRLIIRQGEDGQFQEYKRPPKEEEIIEAINTLVTVIKGITSRDEINSDEVDDIMNSMRRRSDGSVSVRIFDRYIVFTDNNAILKNIMSLAELRYDDFVKQNIDGRSSIFRTPYDIRRNLSQGAQNAIRGSYLEYAETLVKMLSLRAELIARGMDTSKADKFIKSLKTDIIKNIQKARSDYQAWRMHVEDIAIYEEDKEIIDAYKELFGDDNNEAILNLIRIGRNSLRTRPCAMSLVTSDVTRFGRRQDTLEIINDVENYVKSLASTGIPESKIRGALRTGIAKEIFKDNNKQYSSLLESNQVTYMPVSLKHCIDLQRAHMGSTSLEAFNDFINAPSMNDPESELRKQYHTEAVKAVGVRNPKELSKYHSTVSKLKDDIDKIPFDAVAITNKGKEIKVSALEQLTTNVLDQLKSNKTFSELAKDDVSKILKQFINKRGNISKEHIDAVKHALTNLSINSKIQKDLEGTGPEARLAKEYLGMRLFHAAGSVDPSLLCDYRQLSPSKKGEDFESYQFFQNDVMKECISSLINGGNWSWEVGNNGIKISHPSGGIITYKIKRKDGKSLVDVEINRQAQQHFHTQLRSGIIPEASQISRMLIHLAEEQKRFWDSASQLFPELLIGNVK